MKKSHDCYTDVSNLDQSLIFQCYKKLIESLPRFFLINETNYVFNDKLSTSLNCKPVYLM